MFYVKLLQNNSNQGHFMNLRPRNIPLYCSLLLLIVSSCRTGDKPDLNIVARVDNNQLMLEQVEKAIPDYFSKEDSLAFATQFIDDWVYKELVYDEALKTISDTAEINRMVEEYRRSLYLMYHERQLLARKLDTVVRDKEIDEYYFSHLYEFVLTRPVIKMHALVLDVFRVDYVDEMRLLRRTKYEDIESLFEFCEKAGMNIVLIDKWLSMEDFYKFFPCEGNLQLEKIEKNGYYECYNDSLRYLIVIDDVIEAGNYAPVEVLADDIKKIILQRRAKEYMTLYKKQLFLQAEGSGRLFIKNKPK